MESLRKRGHDLISDFDHFKCVWCDLRPRYSLQIVYCDILRAEWSNKWGYSSPGMENYFKTKTFVPRMTTHRTNWGFWRRPSFRILTNANVTSFQKKRSTESSDRIHYERGIAGAITRVVNNMDKIDYTAGYILSLTLIPSGWIIPSLKYMTGQPFFALNISKRIKFRALAMSHA